MKKSILLALLLNICCCHAQRYLIDIPWQQTLGTGEDDYLSQLKLSSNGKYIMAGSTHASWGGSNHGFFDYVYRIPSVDFNYFYIQMKGGSKDDGLASIQQTSDGGYIIGGTSSSNISGDKLENSRGGADLWILKTDAYGEIQWQKTIGGNDEDYMTSILPAADGGYIIGASSMSNLSSEKTQNSFGDLDYWIIKISSTGTIQWQKTIGGSNHDNLYSIQAVSDGYILAGALTAIFPAIKRRTGGIAYLIFTWRIIGW